MGQLRDTSRDTDSLPIGSVKCSGFAACALSEMPQCQISCCMNAPLSKITFSVWSSCCVVSTEQVRTRVLAISLSMFCVAEVVYGASCTQAYDVVLGTEKQRGRVRGLPYPAPELAPRFPELNLPCRLSMFIPLPARYFPLPLLLRLPFLGNGP